MWSFLRRAASFSTGVRQRNPGGFIGLVGSFFEIKQGLQCHSISFPVVENPSLRL